MRRTTKISTPIFSNTELTVIFAVKFSSFINHAKSILTFVHQNIRIKENYCCGVHRSQRKQPRRGFWLVIRCLFVALWIKNTLTKI